MNTKINFFFPYLTFLWTIIVFSYVDGSISFFSIVFMVFLYIIGKENYKVSKITRTNLSFNIALLPLMLANILLTPSIIMGDKITDSGLIYIIVPIYSPILFVVSLSAFTIINALRK